MQEDDRQLVARLLAGDERAFREFFDEYFDRLYRFAMSRTRGDGSFAEEAAQRALIRAVRRLDGFRGESSLFTWLARICRNELADMGEIAARDAARNLSLDGSEHVRREAEAVAAQADAGSGQERDAADTAPRRGYQLVFCGSRR
jgi:RNA polymerase sigma-70 factor (ECF subfamily)